MTTGSGFWKLCTYNIFREGFDSSFSKVDFFYLLSVIHDHPSEFLIVSMSLALVNHEVHYKLFVNPSSSIPLALFAITYQYLSIYHCRMEQSACAYKVNHVADRTSFTILPLHWRFHCFYKCIRSNMWVQSSETECFLSLWHCNEEYKASSIIFPLGILEYLCFLCISL